MKLLRLILLIGLLLTINCNKDVQAILLSTSKFWFNYRQGANSLIMYNQLKQNGIKNSNILVQLPENIACNPRNNDPGVVSCYDGKSYPNLFVNPVVDYRHTDVSVVTLLNQIRGRYPANLPQSKKLNLNENTRLLIYVNGHGGDGYLKMQDTHVISAADFGKAIRELHQKEMYYEVLAISDSCEAATLFYDIDVPNVFAIGSSTRGQRSLSHGRDNLLNLAKTDKFTYITNEFLSGSYLRNPKSTLAEMMKIYTREFLEEDFEAINTFNKKTEKNILVADFFSSVKPKEILFGKLDIQNMNLHEQKFVEEFDKFMESEEEKSNFNNYSINEYSLINSLNSEEQIINLKQLENSRTLIIQ